MKRTIFFVLAAMGCGTAFGQSIVEDFSSSSAVIVRDPARQASTDIDAAIYNPAGTAFVNDGFHLSLSGVGHISTTKASTSSAEYKIKENYVLPSFQAVYKKGDWAFSVSFASEGGAGFRDYKDGSPYYDYLNNQSLLGVVKHSLFNYIATDLKNNYFMGGLPASIYSNDQLRYKYNSLVELNC